MDVKVSPAVVVVVLVLIAAILVGLYFLVIAKPVPQDAQGAVEGMPARGMGEAAGSAAGGGQEKTPESAKAAKGDKPATGSDKPAATGTPESPKPAPGAGDAAADEASRKPAPAKTAE